MSEELIIIKQLPIIEQKLQIVKDEITKKTEKALSLVCCEDTVKEIKSVRAELKKELTAWEDKRKEVKAAVIEPYEKFEATYKECVADIYKNADMQLKEKIDAVENELKLKKAETIKRYFYECRDADERLAFLTFEQAEINVTLSASEKSLKTEAKKFVKRVIDEINLIETQNYKDEILYEYKQSLNVSEAVTMVAERHKAIESEKQKAPEAANVAAVNAAPAKEEYEKKNVLSAPTVEEKMYKVSFTVRATAEKIKELKAFLIRGGYEYE